MSVEIVGNAVNTNFHGALDPMSKGIFYKVGSDWITLQESSI